MITRFVSFLSFGFIIVGCSFIIYQSYWLSNMFLSVEKDVHAPYSKPGIGKAFQTVTSFPIEEGEKIGILSIPKLEKTLPIYEGVGEDILKKGIGHIPSTPLPGQQSNAVLSGHRDTFFRGLDRLKIGDSLIVTSNNKTYIFKIKKIRIVDKNDQTVIVPKPRSSLTLTTCYPFTYIGPAPQRYIIEAQLLTKPKIEQ
ncbi:class D sortase [Metabacillus halosaccharovorans]|uniref:Class D sortase n=1 Tax=Metabacillus halosaccharovorans TaxID=930124 RepID=A0ABT3DIW5_9BACI|nr:class D sortase [Metabacillus halosaccharovorans]MCV9886461.1 class D sortase [Metabacillus halosaccharovorans]